MNDWNHTLFLATRSALKHVDGNDKNNSVLVSTIRAMFEDFSEGLMEPEPAREPYPGEVDADMAAEAERFGPPFVQTPGGRAWYIDKETGQRFVVTTEIYGPLSSYRFLAPAEAFRPGAVVRWKFPDCKGHLEGEVCGFGETYLDVQMGRGKRIDVPTVQCALVQPAPEEKE